MPRLAVNRYLVALPVLLLCAGLAGQTVALLPDVRGSLGLVLGATALAAAAELGRRLFLYYTDDPGWREVLGRAYWPALALMVCLTLIFYGILLSVAWRGHAGFLYDDEPVYDRAGLLIAERWRSDSGVAVPWVYATTIGDTIAPGIVYPWFVGAIYFLFGYHPILVRLANVLFGLWAAAAAAGLARAIFPDQPIIARRTFWGVAFLPHILIWSMSFTRDIQVISCCMLVLWTLAMVFRQKRLSMLWVGACALGWLFFLRPISAVFLMGAVLPVLVTRALRKSQVRLHQPAHSIALILLVGGLGLLPSFFREASFKASQYGLTDSAFIAALDIFELPKGLAVMLHPSPFWALKERAFIWQYYFMPGLSWYLTMPLWVWGVFKTRRERSPELWGIRLFLVMLLLLSFLSTNTAYSDPMRLRSPVLPCLALFTMWTLSQPGQSQLQGRPFQALALAFYAVLVVSGSYDLLNEFLSLSEVVLFVTFLLCVIAGAIAARRWLPLPRTEVR